MMQSAGDLVRRIFADALRPAAPMRLSHWLSENLVLVDGPLAGETWDPAGAPYLVEIADTLMDDHPANLVTVRKSQQTGASILALGWCLYIADREPANALYAVPGIDALRDINGQKLQPLIDAWQRRTGRQVIVPQTSRSGTGSTTYEKRFPGGYLSLANANSVMDLSMKTVKKGVKDEVSKWQDIPGIGDPEVLFFGRFTAFRRLRNYKILEISTPEVDTGDELGEAAGHCRIDRSFRRSDQRFWHVPCPQCGSRQVMRFEHFKADRAAPHRSHYQMQCCGYPLSEAERVPAVRDGEWIATAEGPDRHPGFHIDAFVSLMMSFEAIAEDWSRCRSEKDRKDFYNLTLGLPFRYRGDAPDHKRLMERREDDLKRGHVPARGLMLVASADVQMTGIYVEVLAIAPNRESWPVDVLFLDGDTSKVDGKAFEALKREVLERTYPDAFGRKRGLDALGVDAGYRSHVVYSWVRRQQRVHPDTGRDLIYALDGRDGWGTPPIGTPRLMDIDLDGEKIKDGVRLWPVGTWPLKGGFYTDLHQEGIRSGKPADPDGYCHFGLWMDEVYFRQITAEHLEDVIVKGRQVGRRWVARGDNHLLDCRVYNMALAEHLGLSTMTDDDWLTLARRRGMPEADMPLFLAAATVGPAKPVEASPADAATEKPVSRRPQDDWFGRDTGQWGDRH